MQNPFPHPLLKDLSIQITALSAKQTEARIKLCVENVLPVSLTFDSLHYRIFIDNLEVVKNGSYIKSIHVGARANGCIYLPMTVYNEQLISVLNKHKSIHMDSAEYLFQLTLFADIPILKQKTFEIKKELPVIYMPEIAIKHMKIDSLNFKKGTVELFVELKNPNTISFKFDHVAYSFSVEGNEWVKGDIPQIIDLRSKSDTILDVPLRLAIGEIIKTFFRNLKNENSSSYQFHLSFQIESENKMIEGTKVTLINSGTFKELKKAARDMKSD